MEKLAVAGDLSLSADVVEKDYVLGWLLAGIYAHEGLAERWVFKGGTCLKKCYFETYRFSEDLDFTLRDEDDLDEKLLKAAFSEIAAWIYDETGIEIPADRLRFDVYRNRRDGLSCEGRVYYKGPLQPGGNLPRIKLDLTVDELLVLPPVERPVAHPYSDLPEGGFSGELLAERTRPRDLYDVINLFRNGEFRPAAAAVLDVLRQKCGFKGIPVPTVGDFAAASDELLADWPAMLGHQLPVLPPFGSFWSALPDFFAWLEGGAIAAIAAAAPIAIDQQTIRPPVGFMRRQGLPGSSSLESVRFGASNRLLVEIDYVNENGERSTRAIEPYSLRRTGAGDIILYGVRADNGQSRSYRVDRIQGARVTQAAFTPRFAIELAPTDQGSIPALATRGRASSFASIAPVRRAGRRPMRARTGPTYVYECAYCHKKFRRLRQNSQLSPHKAPGGWQCPGRTGFLVETKYRLGRAALSPERGNRPPQSRHFWRTKATCAARGARLPFRSASSSRRRAIPSAAAVPRRYGQRPKRCKLAGCPDPCCQDHAL